MDYSAADVTRLLGFSMRRLRSYVDAGLLEPQIGSEGTPRFGFQDLVLLRTAKGLHDAHISPVRIRKALAKLRAELPKDRPLSALAISAWGNRIVVRDGKTRFHPESGQALFDFDVEDLRREVTALAEASLKGAVARSPASLSADELYEEALALEEVDVEAAVAAYRQALSIEPKFAEAHVNLGRLLHEQARYAEAESHYRQALAIDPGDALAAFNLAVVLEDQNRYPAAIRQYLQALAMDPSLTDAHHNLARLYEAQGDRQGAARHLRALAKLTKPGAAGRTDEEARSP